MEVLHRYGTRLQKERWLKPLMNGEIRSAFLMTEPGVASSDATNIQCEIRRDGDDYVLNGRKWWSSGAGDPRCKVAIVMGKTDTEAQKHKQQSMVLVPLDAPGITIERALTVYGYDDAPHGHMEIELKDVRVSESAMLLGEGRGFEIAQGTARPRPHPPLHAHDRRGRRSAEGDGHPPPEPRRFRQEADGAFDLGAARGAGRDRHRHVPPASASRRPT
jgi:alkylation response protein AidB-like acyl-CoA dehydrogenase